MPAAVPSVRHSFEDLYWKNTRSSIARISRGSFITAPELFLTFLVPANVPSLRHIFPSPPKYTRDQKQSGSMCSKSGAPGTANVPASVPSLRHSRSSPLGVKKATPSTSTAIGQMLPAAIP